MTDPRSAPWYAARMGLRMVKGIAERRPRALDRRAASHRIIAAYDLFLGAGLLLGIWAGLPDRWWPVDVGGTALGVLLVLVSFGLFFRKRWAEPAALAIASVTCAAGALLVTAIAVTAGQLAGMYGPVGAGGSAILGTAFLLLVPYLVVFPGAQVYFLLRVEADRSPEEPQ